MLHFNIIKDPILAFVAIISFSMPTAYSLMVLSTNYTDFSIETSKIISYTFLVSVITLPVVVVLIL
jgi:predicted permease